MCLYNLQGVTPDAHLNKPTWLGIKERVAAPMFYSFI